MHQMMSFGGGCRRRKKDQNFAVSPPSTTTYNKERAVFGGQASDLANTMPQTRSILTTPLLLVFLQIAWSATAQGITSAPDELSSSANLPNQASESSNEAVVSALRAVSEQLDRFNTLYVGKLEARMLSVATLLANIDANIKNLQERAHVWDTFQLHVSAWNEQLKALDRKVDILNRGQEQLPVLDGKVTQLLSTDEQLVRLVKRADEADTKLAGIARALEDSGGEGGTGSNPLSEFAARGALTTLKNIERKVERLGTQLRHAEQHTSNSEAGGGRLVVKCQSPPALEALLHDVSSKVDVLFDRLPEEGEGELRSGESAVLSRVFRRLSSPLRRTWRALEGVERAVREGEESAAALRQTQKELVIVANRTLAHALQGSECCLAQKEYEREWRAEASVAIQEFRAALYNASLEREQLAVHLDELAVDHNASCSNNIFSLEEDGGSHEESDVGSHEKMTSSMEVDEDVTTAPPRWLCHELQEAETSGVYDSQGRLIDIDVFEVTDSRDFLLCDHETAGGGWTVIQLRGDFGEPRQNFTRSWADYERGFGDLRAEFWSGLRFLHRATNIASMRLRVELSDFEGNTTNAEYSVFRVLGPVTQYKLRVGGYSGNASDSLSAHDKVAFSTVDQDNDEAPACCPCAPTYGGGWWFYSCFEANLNGEYHEAGEDNTYFRGIIWEHWRGDYSLATAQMKIRPLDFEPR